MEINLPLISPVSRKYYNYAREDEEKTHHRAVDIRVCLEKVCDEIIIEFVSMDTKNKWSKFNLHEKIKSSKEFMNNTIVDRVLKAKTIGNIGAH